jgi:Zn-dependent peptidase ImmA (M78 family)
MNTFSVNIYSNFISFINNYQNKLSLKNPETDFENKILPYEKDLQLKYVSQILISDDDGVYISSTKTILISQNISYLPRVLFTKYHEFTHFLIDNYLPNFKDFLKKYDDTNSTIEEDLCNKGASEFLLGNTNFSYNLPDLVSSPSLLKNVLEKNNYVSSPAILYRIANNTTCKIISIILHNDVNPIKQTGDINLIGESLKKNISPYIEYHFESPAIKYPLKRFFTIKNDHLLSNLPNLTNIKYMNERTYIPYSKYEGKIPCTVTGFYNTQRKRFYGMLNLDDVPTKSNKQLSLIE